MTKTVFAASMLGAMLTAVVSAHAQGVPTGPEPAGPVAGGLPTAAGPNWTPTAEGALVRQRIHDAGYGGVTILERNPDGSWSGQALKGDTLYLIKVDPTGRVSQ